MIDRPQNATVLRVNGMSGSVGYASELTYTVALHGSLGDIIYDNVVPYGRPPYSEVVLIPAGVGSPAFVSWDRDIARFYIPEWPATSQCEVPA